MKKFRYPRVQVLSIKVFPVSDDIRDGWGFEVRQEIQGDDIKALVDKICTIIADRLRDPNTPSGLS